MNRREKTLGSVVAGIGVFFAGAILVKVVFLKPIRDLDKKNATLLEQLQKAKTERQNFFRDEDFLKAQAERTCADQVEVASAKSGALLTHEILRSGLSEASFTRTPVGPRKLPGAEELGWHVQGSGPFTKIVNLLFVLEKSPLLHKIENLTLSPGDGPDSVVARFNFLTLVINAGPPDVTYREPDPKPDLASPLRQRYETIVARNLLRPYVPPPPTPPSPAPKPATPLPPGLETYRVVSLSEWQGTPEIHVRDLTQNKTLRYKTGDPLAGGVVVTVDYRPLPKPGHAGLLSFSRVIIKIGPEYWAIEKGQTLAEKYRLTPDQLPPGLPSS